MKTRTPRRGPGGVNARGGPRSPGKDGQERHEEPEAPEAATRTQKEDFECLKDFFEQKRNTERQDWTYDSLKSILSFVLLQGGFAFDASLCGGDLVLGDTNGALVSKIFARLLATTTMIFSCEHVFDLFGFC